MDEGLTIDIKGHLLITDVTNDKILLDKTNAIHPQNMSRIIARALSNEPNSIIKRIAFGNGGTFVDVGGSTVFNAPNIGDVSGWESRLYNETYSEVVDESDADLGIDLGSSGPNSVRTGGGSDPSSDPTGAGVVSEEVGKKSNIVITAFLNENEPSGQDETILSPSGDEFIFDEIGLYSPGKDAIASAGHSSVNVGNKNSEDISLVTPGSTLNLDLTVDGNSYTSVLTVPGAGTGPGGEITYGDICEGINTGSWITSGDSVNDFVFIFITDISGGTYPSIVGRQSYGLLTFQSKTTGTASNVTIGCDIGDVNDFSNVVTAGVCANSNVSQISGDVAGSSNDPVTPGNERERLLTHIIFSPIPKATDVAISIVYTLTVTVKNTSDAVVSIL